MLYDDGFPHCVIRLIDQLKAYLASQVPTMEQLVKIQQFKYNTDVERLIERFIFLPCCHKLMNENPWFQANAIHQLKLLEILLAQFTSVQSIHISYCLLDAIFGISSSHDEVK